MDDEQRNEFFKLLSEAMKAAHCLNNRPDIKVNKNPPQLMDDLPCQNGSMQFKL